MPQTATAAGVALRQHEGNDAKHTNGLASGSPNPRSPPGHHRSQTIDNSELIEETTGSLEHGDVDHDLHSLPSLDDHGGDETAGLSSSVSSNNQEAFVADGIPAEVLGALSSPSIEDNTPAAEALRANAEVKVRPVGKLARKVHAQSVRRLVKKATFSAKSGNVRGKPPRIPARTPSDILVTGPDSDMFVVEEEDENILGMDSSIDSSEQGEIKHDDHAAALAAAAAGTGPEPVIEEEEEEEEVPEEDKQDVPDWQKPFKDGADMVPAEVLTATVETGKKVLGNVDPHDILQTHRWKRRKRKGHKDKRKSYVKGKVINRKHELYALSLAVMLGVRTSIGATNARMGSSHGKHWLTSDDFMESQKYEFSPKGGPKTPPHQLSHTFKFKDYSPMVFAYLRRMFGVNEFDFLLSVCGNANFIEFISNAKSGQFFFYSSDGKYMIKTMTNAESKFLRRILPHYFRHCSKNPNTLLTKFLGLYRVKMYHLRREVKFVIMNSVYYTDKPLQTFFDLKGSVLGRAAKEVSDVQKDNDLRRDLPNSAIALPPDVRERVREQLVADCEFMQQMDIMDYSMLIGIHHVPLAQERSHASDSVAKTGFNVSKRRDSLSLRDLMKRKRQSQSALPDHDSFDAEGELLAPMTPRTSSKTARSMDGVSSASKSVSSTGSQKLPHEKSMDSTTRFAAMTMLDQGYDDDDDCSYLEGSEEATTRWSTVRQSTTDESMTKPGDSMAVSKIEDIELKKAQTVEQIYWPFHRYFDIYGYRRMEPTPCTVCGKVDCSCGKDEGLLLAGLKIPPFVPPLSNRKDGGLMMDTTGVGMPMKVTIHGKEQFCEGKIFYMGIIDILQQYNVRKRFEASFRRVQSKGWQNASCVDPQIYADRFVRFFDEYSQGGDVTNRHANTGGQGEGDGNRVVEKDGEPTSGASFDSVRITGSPASGDIEVSQLKED